MFKSTELALNYFEFPLMNPKCFSFWHVDVCIMIQIIPAVMSAADKTTDDGNWGCFRWQQHDDCCTLSFCCQNLCAFMDTFVCVCVCVWACVFVCMPQRTAHLSITFRFIFVFVLAKLWKCVCQSWMEVKKERKWPHISKSLDIQHVPYKSSSEKTTV